LEEYLQSSSPRSAATDNSSREPPDVAALTRAMAKGDEMAWRTFYDAYFDRLWRYLLVVAAGHEDAAREALQTTLLRVTRYIKVFRDENAFWSWLTVLARSAFADETRKRRRYFSFLDRFTRYAVLESEIRNDHHADERLRVLLASTWHCCRQRNKSWWNKNMPRAAPCVKSRSNGKRPRRPWNRNCPASAKN
jgi:hypothetical protein